MIVLLIIAQILILWGYVPSHGLFWDDHSLFLLIAAFFILIILRLRYEKWEKHFSYDGLETWLFWWAFVEVAMSLTFDCGIYYVDAFLVTFTRLLFVIAILFLLSYSLKISNSFLDVIFKYRFTFLLLIALIIRIITIINSPRPAIDVFWILNEAPQHLLEGQSPYSIIFTQVYKTRLNDVYSYFPGTFLFTVPVKLIFNDIRYAYIIGDFVSLYFIYKLITKSQIVANLKLSSGRIAELFCLIFLYRPMSLFVIEQSWTEPILFMLLCAFIYLYSNKKYYLAYFLMGLLFSIKQTILLLLIFLGRLEQKRIKYVILSIAVTVIICLPFLIWDGANMVHDTIIYVAKFPPMPYMLTLNTLFFKYFHKNINFAFLALGMLVLFLIFLTKKNDTLDKAFFSSYIILFGLYLSRIASANYYFFIDGCIVLHTILLYLKILKNQSKNVSRPS